MRVKIAYEWDLETFDIENGDILDHRHDNDLPYLKRCREGGPGEEGLSYALVLVYNAWTEEDGIVGRAWAYEEDGVMPKHFDNGVPVPIRFINAHTKIFGELEGNKSK
tara:strand:+ start:340 stop:663 length:324 start_codon:yes stop_codon:yes gene_type:complete